MALLESVVLLARKDFEGVSTEIVTLQGSIALLIQSNLREQQTHLSLDNISWDNFAPVAVEEGQSSAEGWSWNTPENSLGNDASPARLCVVDG